MAQYIGTTVITSVVAGTNCSGGGNAGIVTVDVDDAFLVNNGSDTTTGTITAAGFTTTGTWTFDEYTSGTIGITTIQDSGTTYNDNDTSLMTAGAISDYVTGLGYSTGDITAVVAGTNLSGGATSGSATITLADASTSAKGAASFNSNHFSTSSGAVSLASTITTDGIVFTSANADDPNIEIKNTNTDNQAARLTMRKDPGEAGADADVIAELEFFSVNDAGSPEAQMYGKIVTSIHDATDGQESGDMEIRVATHDGELQEGIKMTGGAAEDEINVTIGGPGATSTTTVSGILEAAKRKMTVSTTADGNTGSGDIVYFGTGSSVVGKIYHYKSDGSWELADANTVANCDGLLAVAIGTDPDVDGMLLRGMVTLIDIQGTEAVGDVLYLSESATGAADCVAPAGSGDIVRVIGYCLTTDDQIWFNPDNTYVELA